MKLAALRRPTAILPAAALATSLLFGAATPADAAITRTWVVDANRHYAVDVQERRITGGDEVYVASIAFRSTPGVAGSTRAWFHGGLSEITSVHAGDWHTIPDTMGRVPFTNVTERSGTDVQEGRNPEVLGTISIVVESDNTPFRLVNDMMHDIARATQKEIAPVVEPLTLADLTSAQLADQLAALAARIKAAAVPTVGRKIRIAFASLFDPDDLIQTKMNLFVAVDPDLADVVDPRLAQIFPAGEGVAGALRARTYQQDFAGDGAHYRIEYAVS